MKPRLFWTILFTFALVIGLSVCGMLGFVGLAVAGIWQPAAMRDSFAETQNTYAASLGDYYTAHGNSWSGIDQRLDGSPFSGAGGFIRYTVVDAQGRVIASNDRRQINQVIPAGQLSHGAPITVGGAKVGTFVLRSGPGALPGEPPQFRGPPAFFWPVIRSFLIAGLGLGSLLLLVAVVFARRLSRPLRDITQAAQQLAAGKLDVQVQRARIRELDDLTLAFNAMARSLSQADRQRRQMTADIAHELRTPLTIIKGRLEGMQDGVYSATPDQVDRLLDETALLERLIEDLRLLALAEAGQLPLYREQLDPHDLLEHARTAFAGQAAEQDVTLSVEAPCDLPQIDADPQRMAQVLANLVSNALRYTPQGGAITLRASFEFEVLSSELALSSANTQNSKLKRPEGTRNSIILADTQNSELKRPEGTRNSVVFRVSDTGQGIDPVDLPHVFDRFYRADRSRTRGSGGAGLGLAIAKQIVSAHGGTIWAESAPGQGTTISIALPVLATEMADLV